MLPRYTWIFLPFLLIVLRISPSAQPETAVSELAIAPDTLTYAAQGNYQVGTRNFAIQDDRGTLHATVWYPALATANQVEITAQPNAAPDLAAGPYPLVVYSHGQDETRESASYFTEHLASYGFVVIAADHAAFADLQTSLDARQVDVGRAIRFVQTLNNDPLVGSIDTTLIAVSGASLGGAAALLTPLDTNVAAVISLAPPGDAYDMASLANVHVPVLWVSSAQNLENDTYQPYRILGSELKTRIIIEQSDARLFGHSCEFWPLAADSLCEDGDFARVHALTTHYATAFLLDVLKHDPDALWALAPEAANLPGLLYRTSAYSAMDFQPPSQTQEIKAFEIR